MECFGELLFTAPLNLGPVYSG